MKTWEKILLYPIGLYIWLTDGIKNISKKWKPAMAMLMAVVMLCGMLPTMVAATGWDDIPDGGVGFYWGSAGFVNVTMPTVEGNYTYGKASTWDAEELAADVSTLPSSGWEWAVQKEADGCRVILNGIYMGISNRNNEGGFLCKSNLTLEMRGSNTIYSWYSPEGAAMIKATGKLDVVGSGSLYLESNRDGISVGGSFNMAGGSLKISAEERTIVASSVELNPNIYALTSDTVNGKNAKTYVYSDLETAKWFYAAYAASSSGYTVKFNPTDYSSNSTGTGTMANVENVVGAYTLPENGFTPEPGMRFKAWKTGNGEKMPGELILITANTTINAVWEDDPDTFTVSYSSNNGSGYIEPVKGVAGSFTLPDNTITPPLGTLFKGWRIDDIEYAPGDTIQVTKNIYVYAVWEDDPATIAVHFDANGGRGSRAPLSNGTAESFQCTLPTNEWPYQFNGPDNTYFAGWLVGETLMQPGDTITVTEDTIVKAVWEIDDYYLTIGGVEVGYQNAHSITGENITGTVTYDLETQTLTLDNATITATDNSLLSAIRADYDFEGILTIHLVGNNTVSTLIPDGAAVPTWNFAIDAGDLAFTGDGSLTVTAGDATGWSYGIDCDNVTFGPDCTVIAYTTANDINFIYAIQADSFAAEDSTVLASTSGTGTPLKAYSELNSWNVKYIKVQPAYNVAVSFDANGGSGTMAEGTPVCSKEYTLPECTLTAPAGKQFKAWSVNGSEKQPGDKVVFIENATVTALWEDATHTCSIEPVEKVWPDCDNGGKEAYFKCDGCGKFFEDAAGTTEITDIATWGNLSKNDHTESVAWEKDGTHHWHVCSVAGCGAVIDSSKAAHTPDRAAATETDPVKCSVCGYEIAPALNHTHTFGSEWKSDKDNHWNECSDGEKANVAAHKDENKDGKCDVCAYNIGLPTPPAQSQETQAPQETQPTQQTPALQTPQTGDNPQLALWFALLMISGFGIMVIYGKKKFFIR